MSKLQITEGASYSYASVQENFKGKLAYP